MNRLIPLAMTTLVLAGCGLIEPEDVTTGPTGTARVEAGADLKIELGEVNSSIGDGWYLTGRPDQAILTDHGTQYDEDCTNPGCGARLTWTFTARKAGTTEVTFQYCYRSQPPACQAGPKRGPVEPQRLTVVVE